MRKRLLVLDDDATVGKILVLVAQSAGFEARLCETAVEFFREVSDWAPTHVAVDLCMPDLDGIQVLRRLAAEGCQARVIVSSGVGKAEIEAALVEARAMGLSTAGALPKPFGVKALRALLADSSAANESPTSS